ncbi:serine/arginine-rich splicing factor RS31-like isoform X2 [Salvia splendens]|nr:serine/arginine-rich splicing factor RS31-like isoform X2 [Salvia splendens]
MGRRLHVDWGTDTGEHRHHDGSESNARPNKTLFVIHYDPVRTRDRDIKSHFEHYGKVLNVTMRRNYAFVDFATQEDATEALKRTHRSKIFDRIISVGYAFQDDDDKHNGRRRNDAPLRSSIPAYRHGQASPDYGRYDGHSHPYRARASHVYDKHGGPSNSRARRPFRARASHVYDRNDGPSNPKARSPSHARASPVYGRYEGPSNPRGRIPYHVRASPVYNWYEDPSNPRARIPYHVRASPVYDKYRGHES